MIRSSRLFGLVLLTCVLLAAACSSGTTSTPSISCMQSLDDYCAQPGTACVKHILLSMNATMTEASFCMQCGTPCSLQSYAFENCEDGALAVATQVGVATASEGVEILTYFYDGTTFDLTAVLDSTSGGTYKAAVTCRGGAQTLADHGTCASTYMLPFQCN